MSHERVLVPVALPKGLTQEIDELVEEGQFGSRADALKFGARLVLLVQKRTHDRAEHYAYHEIKDGIQRGMKGR